MADDLRKDLHLADRPVPFLGRALLVHRLGFVQASPAP
jgi:hypothetical protein